MKTFVIVLVTIMSIIGCTGTKKEMSRSVNVIAEDYVRLVLDVGQYNSDFVDAYYGPEFLKPSGVTKEKGFPSERFLQTTKALQDELNSISKSSLPGDQKVRVNMLNKQLLAVYTKIEIIAGKTYRFDEEAKRLYDAQAPSFSMEYFDDLLVRLNEKLPGEGSVSERYNKYADGFIIPKDKLDVVFKTAINEARKRTLKHFPLPNNENFVLEYVKDKSWSGYNYYKGKGQSLIQINTDLPIYIDRAIDLACHEGYPGHHVFNALLEENLVINKGWVEFSVYPLFSPQSLIAEGSANYGIDVAFPGSSRIDYEKQVLFPLAGIEPSKAEEYYAIQALRSKLNYAGNEAARQYLNGDINRDQAAMMLSKYLLYTPERAQQRTRFIDQYRSYVINYNLGKDLVDDYVEAKGGTLENPKKRWQIFKDLLSNPHTASTLKSN